MGLIDPGYPARDYSNYRPRIPVKCFEGNLKFSATGFGADGRPIGTWDVTEPMVKTQYVKLHPDSNPWDIIVQPEPDASKAIGKLIINPTLGFDIGWTDDDQNVLPRENTEWGHYVPRGGTVEFFGAAVDELEIVVGNKEININDFLNSEADMQFDKSTDETNWIALAHIDALKGGFIPALAMK